MNTLHPAALLSTLDNNAPIAALDFETYYDKEVSVKTLGNWAYCRHELWDCYLVAIRRARRLEDGSWFREPTIVCHPSELAWGLLHGHRIYSHNAGFDQTVFRELVHRGLAPADLEALIEGWDCTADFSAYKGNVRSLAEAVQFFFGRTLNKKVRDDAKGKRWPKDFTAEQQAEMLTYGGTDADECLEIAILAQDQFPDKERLLARLTRLQAMRGVRINTAKLRLYLDAARQRTIEVMREIPWASRIDPKTRKLIPPTSPKAYCAYCREHGIPVPPVKAKEGEDAFIEWEAEHAADHPVIAAVSTYRSIGKVVKQLELIERRTDEHGLFRFSLKFFGGHTGRWSGDSGFNMQAITKADSGDTDVLWIATDERGCILHAGPVNRLLMTRFADYEKELRAAKKSLPGEFTLDGLNWTLLDMRSLFIPREGNKFCIADSSQIEPRVLAGLTNDNELIELLKSGVDLYEAHARIVHGFDGPLGSLKVKANIEKITKYIILRGRSKAEALGLRYQAGPKGFVKAAVMLAGVVLSMEEALESVQKFRATNPKITGYWDMLHNALDSKVGSTLRLRLPSGRVMSYRAVRKERKLFKGNDGKPEWRWQLTAETDGGRYGYYGGKLCENMCQAVARDVFSDFVLMVWEASYLECLAAGLTGHEAYMRSLDKAPLWTVHDEMITEFPEAEAKEKMGVVMSIMRLSPDNMAGVPFDCEAHLADRYLK